MALVNRILERYPDKGYIDKNLGRLTQFDDVKDNSYWAYYDIFEASNEHNHNQTTKKRVLGK